MMSMNYVIYGEETYQVRKAIDAIIRKEIGERDAMNTVVYNALQSDMETILEDAQTIPFFTDKKCILIQNANFLSANNDTDLDVSLLDTYLQKPLETTVLIFSGAFAKLDMRKKIVKSIVSRCKVSVCNKLDKDSIAPYVKEQLTKRNIALSPPAFLLFCQRLPYDIGIIQSELDKLELYGNDIDEEVIKALTTRSLEEDVFALVHAVVEKDIKKCFSIWEDLQVLNKDPIYLIALISSQFHLLYRVKCELLQGNKAQDTIAKNLGVHPYRVKLALNICRGFSIDAILDVLAKLADLDQSIKAGKIDKKIGFELFLLHLKGC